MNIGDLFFSFRGDSKQLELDAKKSGQKAGQTIGQQMTTALKTGDWGSFLKAGLGLGAGLAVFGAAKSIIGGVGDEVGALISAASDLEESQSKVDAVFEESSGTVRDWASGLDTAYGISEQAALEAAGTFGNFLQALGTTQEESVRLSTSLTELAGDLGSFNNVARDDVLVALRSGLAGESEPMRRLGIDISAARVESLLLARGIEKVNGKFTEGQKVQGRYLAIMQDTVTAQGDAQRTTDTLAGKQRKLDAAVANLSASLGGLIIGPATDFLGFLVDIIDLSPDVTARVSDINDRVRELSKTTEEIVEATSDLVDEWEPLTTMDLPPWARLGAFRDIGDDLVEYGNKLRLTRQELFDLVNLQAGRGIQTTRDLAESLREAYYAYDPLSSASTRTASAVSESADDIADANTEITQSYATMSKRVVRQLSDLPPSISDTIKSGKSTVRQAMTELRFAMEHPFAGDKYTTFLEKKQRIANKLLEQALKDGNVAGANQARALVDGIQAELDKLDDQTYSVDVMVDATGRRRVGAAPGRAAGGPVEAGRAYWVGERGPELVVPAQNGRVIPTETISTSPAGGQTIHAQIYGLPMQASTPRETVAELRRAARMGLSSRSPLRGFQPA